MAIENQIRHEKLQYDINREAAKILTLSSGKIDKYEYLTGEEILPSNQQQIIEQAKCTYSPLGKAFEKQTKTTEDQTKIIKDKKEQTKETQKQLDKHDDDDIKKGNLSTNKKERYLMSLLNKEEKQCMTCIVQLNLIIYYVITKVLPKIKISVCIMTQKVFLI